MVLVPTLTWNASTTSSPHQALGPFYDLRELVLAAMLAALAGAAGAAAWLYTSGWYVTFMTGNTERLVLEHFKGEHVIAFGALATVLVFVAGAITATLARVYLWRKARHGATRVMTAATIAACLSDMFLVAEGDAFGVAPVMCLAFGLGALNTSISRRGEVVMPLSYMTGTLVKIGQGIALHVASIRRWGWVPHATTISGFVAGAVLGGALFSNTGTHHSLLALAAISLIISVATWFLDHHGFIADDVY